MRQRIRMALSTALSSILVTATVYTASTGFASPVFARSDHRSAVAAGAKIQTGSAAPVLVALGDSITFGYNLPDTRKNTVPSAEAFPYVIARTDYMQVRDLAVPGWTSANLLQALSTAKFQAAIHSASVISIDIGSNDLLQFSGPFITQATAQPNAPIHMTKAQEAAFAAAITSFHSNLVKIITKVRQQTSAPILLYNLYNPFPVGTGLNIVTEQFEASLDAFIASVAQSTENVTLVDAHQAFAGQQLTYVRVLQHDVHPTALGQFVLAQRGEQALLPYLGRIFGGRNISLSVSHTETTYPRVDVPRIQVLPARANGGPAWWASRPHVEP